MISMETLVRAVFLSVSTSVVTNTASSDLLQPKQERQRIHPISVIR